MIIEFVVKMEMLMVIKYVIKHQVLNIYIKQNTKGILGVFLSGTNLYISQQVYYTALDF